MNRFTARELEKIRDIIPVDWDDTTTHIVIPGLGRIPENPIKIGDRFTIKIENYIINQPPNFTLSENWNQGTFPPEEILEVEIVKQIGKMTGVKAVGKETRIEWEGWLPNKGFKII